MLLLVIADPYKYNIRLRVVADEVMKTLLRKVNGCSWNGPGCDTPDVDTLYAMTSGSGNLEPLFEVEYQPGDSIEEVVTFYED